MHDVGPPLPSQAAYLNLNNPSRRNALSLSVLRDLRSQLHAYNTSSRTGKLLILPPFNPKLLPQLEAAFDGDNHAVSEEYGWLVDPERWRREREGLPDVIVLRSPGSVFCAGHDLEELSSLSHEQVKETFALCAEVMGLIRRSPAVVVGVIQGLATAAGAQLALTTDYPITTATTPFRLPGASLGLPCTSPSTSVSRRLGPAFTYRMLAMAEPVLAKDLPGGAVDIADKHEKGRDSFDADAAAAAKVLEERVKHVVGQLAERTAPQPQALGKWAYWTQVGLSGGGAGGGGDGYEEAAEWTGRVMALHARSGDTKEGVGAFLEKRTPSWAKL